MARIRINPKDLSAFSPKVQEQLRSKLNSTPTKGEPTQQVLVEPPRRKATCADRPFSPILWVIGALAVYIIVTVGYFVFAMLFSVLVT